MPKVNNAKYSARQMTGAYIDNGEKHLTKQSFVENCDINRIMDRAKKGASLSHLANFKGEYGDFSDWNEHTYEDMCNDMARAQTIFNDLPAELRNEFDNNPGKFLGFVNDPKNAERLEEIFPVLAEPGRQFPDVIGGLATTLEVLNETLAAPSSDGPSASDASTSTDTTT